MSLRHQYTKNSAILDKEFRAEARRLLELDEADWTDWELDWLEAMLRYADNRVHSPRELEKLTQLQWLSKPFLQNDGLTIQEMVGICLRYIADFDEDDGEFINSLHRRNARQCRRRQLRRLVRLCRQSGEHVSDHE